MTDNVISALAKVEAEIGGIGKTQPKGGSLGYAYRGIDAIAAQAQPLFGQHGIVIVPTETTITTINELSVNGRPWVDVFVTVAWTIYGPGGIDDYVTATTIGVGRDNSDKGPNKACTQAYKNLLLRLLCIGDPKDDADQPEHQTNYTDLQIAPRRDFVAEVKQALDVAGIVGKDERLAKVREIAGRAVSGAGQLTPEEADRVIDALTPPVVL